MMDHLHHQHSSLSSSCLILLLTPPPTYSSPSPSPWQSSPPSSPPPPPSSSVSTDSRAGSLPVWNTWNNYDADEDEDDDGDGDNLDYNTTQYHQHHSNHHNHHDDHTGHLSKGAPGPLWEQLARCFQKTHSPIPTDPPGWMIMVAVRMITKVMLVVSTSSNGRARAANPSLAISALTRATWVNIRIRIRISQKGPLESASQLVFGLNFRFSCNIYAYKQT